MPARRVEIPREAFKEKTIDQIAEEYGCARRTVQLRKNELGIVSGKHPGPDHKVPTPEIVSKWVELYQRDNLNIPQIQARFQGWSRHKIGKHIREALGVDRLVAKNGSEGWFGS